jgi:ribokinase
MTIKPRIAVFGSVHMDLIAHAALLPEKATSGLAHGFTMAMGGKGGNQAVECVKAGAEAFMVTQLGDDEFGRSLLASLKTLGVDCAGVAVAKDLQTGASTVLSAAGGYTSLIYPGAAAAMTAEDVAARIGALAPLDLVLLQLELPMALSLAAASAAKKVGARVVLNASPEPVGLAALLALTDVVVVNESEALAMGTADVVALARKIDGAAVITLGAEGSVASDGHAVWRQEALPVTVKSTVGAGDAFLAGLCVALCREFNLELGLTKAAQSAKHKLSSL